MFYSWIPCLLSLKFSTFSFSLIFLFSILRRINLRLAWKLPIPALPMISTMKVRTRFSFHRNLHEKFSIPADAKKYHTYYQWVCFVLFFQGEFDVHFLQYLCVGRGNLSIKSPLNSRHHLIELRPINNVAVSSFFMAINKSSFRFGSHVHALFSEADIPCLRKLINYAIFLIHDRLNYAYNNEMFTKRCFNDPCKFAFAFIKA